MEINTKQRAALRSMANGLETILHVGKEGVTPNVIAQTQEALLARELVKGCVQQNCPLSAREACEELAVATGAAPVQVIGRRFVLYQPHPETPVIRL